MVHIEILMNALCSLCLYSFHLVKTLAFFFVVVFAFTHQDRVRAMFEARRKELQFKRFYLNAHVPALQSGCREKTYYLCMCVDVHTMTVPSISFSIYKRYQFSDEKKNCYFVWIATRGREDIIRIIFSPENHNRRFYYSHRILIYLIFCYKVHKNVPRPRCAEKKARQAGWAGWKY